MQLCSRLRGSSASWPGARTGNSGGIQRFQRPSSAERARAARPFGWGPSAVQRRDLGSGDPARLARPFYAVSATSACPALPPAVGQFPADFALRLHGAFPPLST